MKTSGPEPEGRNHYAAVCLDFGVHRKDSHHILMIGGISVEEIMSDLWILNLEQHHTKWREVQISFSHY